MIPYHYIGYCNPISDCYFTQLNYSEIIAELWKFSDKKEKSNMNDNIEITVKVNGVVTPLHQISELTLSKIREASKSKEIPVARIVNFHDSKRLILKVSDSIKERINNGAEVIAIDLIDGGVVGHWSLADDSHPCYGANFYDNIQTIS